MRKERVRKRGARVGRSEEGRGKDKKERCTNTVDHWYYSFIHTQRNDARRRMRTSKTQCGR